MRDIRLLTLYKQHYLDAYKKNSLKAGISCLGYYDGITIQKIAQNQGERIALKKSRAPISEVWFHVGEQTQKLRGGISNQNIGIFRYCNKMPDAVGEKFWNTKEKYPYFSVGFLKLDNIEIYEKVKMQIEEINEIYTDESEKVCRIITYLTFDNADIIVFVKGNSVKELEKILYKIEYMDDIKYAHYIWGIDEEYLEQCSNSDTVLPEWNGKSCFLDEDIAKIQITVTTSGKKEVVKWLERILENENENCSYGKKPAFGEKMSYSYMVGHSNCYFEFKGASVSTLVMLLRDKGFLTHDNIVYGNGLYNIETTFLVEQEKLKSDISVHDLPNPKNEIEGICKLWLEKYGEYYSDDSIIWDEALYSYYQSWMQTLNILDQYERFQMSNDIFCLIYPSLVMFEKRLYQNIQPIRDMNKRQNKVDYEKTTRQLKKLMCEYLEYVNSVIYHTIHTDQMYLMIPGYCGTPYTIPIKLNIFYHWYTSKVIEILNDGERKFGYILTPSIESIPHTKTLDFRVQDEKQQLICIKLSQRTLFMPRNLMIILTHELGHYVGRHARHRKFRKGYLINIISKFIAEALILNPKGDFEPVDYKKEMRKVWEEYIRDILVAKINSMLTDMMSTSDEHTDIMAKTLTEACKKILIKEDENSTSIYCDLYAFPAKIMKIVQQKEGNYAERLRYFSRLQEEYNYKRKHLLSSDLLGDTIQTITKLFREIYSDMAAFAILQCSFGDFKESFFVSEGIHEKLLVMSTLHRVRLEIVRRTNPNKEDISGTFLKQPRRDDYNFIVREEIYTEEWILEPLVEYAENCLYSLEKHLNNKKKKTMAIDNIRNAYKMFCDEEMSCRDIYYNICQCIYSYQEEILREKKEELISQKI